MSDSVAIQVKTQMFFSRYMTSPGLHRFFYRITNGRIGSRLPGVAPGVLLLTTTGRKTGNTRTTPLVYFEIGDDIVVAATNNGSDRHPDWYWNLSDGSEASIQIEDESRRVLPRFIKGDEHSKTWRAISRIHPLFAAYQKLTDRQIPVIALDSVG